MIELNIFEGEYVEESLNDLERDIYEAFDPIMNPIMDQVPKPEGLGKYVVKITWLSV